jgi:hypothetical protein
MAKDSKTKKSVAKTKKPVAKTTTSKKPEVVGWSIKDNTTDSSDNTVFKEVLRIFDEHIETLDEYGLYKMLRQQYTCVSLKIIEHRNGRVLEIYSEYLTRLWFRISINLDTKKISMNYGEKQSSYLAQSPDQNNGTHTSFWLILVRELTEKYDFTKVDNAYDA